MKPTLLEGQRHRIRAISDKSILKAWLMGSIKFFPIGVICFSVGGGIGYIMRKDPTSNTYDHFIKPLLGAYKDHFVIYSTLGVSAAVGLAHCWLAYGNSYSNNLNYSFKPGTVILDKAKQENSKFLNITINKTPI